MLKSLTVEAGCIALYMEENLLLFKLKELEYIDKMSEKISQISITGGGQILDQLKELLTGNLH